MKKFTLLGCLRIEKIGWNVLNGIQLIQLQVYRHKHLGGVLMQVYRQLQDETQDLPWEDGRLSAQDKKKLLMFRNPILKLLRRKPTERSTAREFCNECCRLFTNNPLSEDWRNSPE